MCLGTVGKIVSISDNTATVSIDGNTREVDATCAPEAKLGSYVMIHLGMIIGIIDDDQAEEMIKVARSARETVL